MNTQENYWKMDFGLLPVPEHLFKPKRLRTVKVNQNDSDIWCDEVRRSIKDKFNKGHLDTGDAVLYGIMKSEGYLTRPNGTVMTYKQFSGNCLRVRREMGVAKLSTKYDAFLNYFDSGMEIKKIAETVGTSVCYVRECLLRFGRIEPGIPGRRKGFVVKKK